MRAEIAVFRARHDIADADTRLTGPEQYAARDRRAQKRLDNLAAQHLGRRDPDTTRFNTLVDNIDPACAATPTGPGSAAHLAQVSRTDVNLPQLLGDAASDGPLPDQMPGAALWWRLAGRLQPAALDKSIHYLRPAWLPDLHRVFGTAIAETIAADPAFARLVAAIDTADPARWTPLDLLPCRRRTPARHRRRPRLPATGRRIRPTAHLLHRPVRQREPLRPLRPPRPDRYPADSRRRRGTTPPRPRPTTPHPPPDRRRDPRKARPGLRRQPHSP